MRCGRPAAELQPLLSRPAHVSEQVRPVHEDEQDGAAPGMGLCAAETIARRMLGIIFAAGLANSFLLAQSGTTPLMVNGT